MSASSTQTRRPTHHFDKNDCFALVVGHDSKELLVHANYLVQDSEFFKTLLSQHWFVPIINMPDIDYDAMTNYLTYAYIEKLPTAHLVEPICDTFTGEEYPSLINLYLLGDRFQNQTLKNATLAEIKRISTLLDIDTEASFPSFEDIDTIYECTNEGDPARRLMVDIFAENARAYWLTPEYSQTFILDLARKLLGGAPFPLFPRSL
jgi:hypothetical protein